MKRILFVLLLILLSLLLKGDTRQKNSAGSLARGTFTQSAVQDPVPVTIKSRRSLDRT